MSFRVINGSCHCGNIRFELAWPKSESVIAVRQCGCEFCSKHGGAWTSHPEAQLTLHVDNPSRVSRYNFATNTADFLVCVTCGVVPLVTSEIENKLYAVVNVNSFEQAATLTFSRSSTNFDDEDTAGRLRRRARNWIPSVRAGKQELSSR